MKIKKKLVLFTKYPKAGKTKTRLAPLIGDEKAAVIQKEMTEFLFEEIHRWKQKIPFDFEVCYDGATLAEMQNWLGKKVSYSSQVKGNLGHRLSHQFLHQLEKEPSHMIAIGSDCPSIDEEIITEAFQSLIEHQVVLGPALDGGYYLIGLKDYFPSLFNQIPWSSERVLETTLNKAKQLRLKTHLLKQLRDIDRPDDLMLWQKIKLKNRIQAKFPTQIDENPL